MSRVFGFLDLSEIRKNAPEGANLYLDFGDGDLVQDIVYYKLTKKGGLLYYIEGLKSWSVCSNPKLVTMLRYLWGEDNLKL